jgi:hypothetical protein
MRRGAGSKRVAHFALEGYEMTLSCYSELAITT